MDSGPNLQSILTFCATLEKLLNLSEPHFLQMYNGDNNICFPGKVVVSTCYKGGFQFIIFIMKEKVGTTKRVKIVGGIGFQMVSCTFCFPWQLVVQAFPDQHRVGSASNNWMLIPIAWKCLPLGLISLFMFCSLVSLAQYRKTKFPISSYLFPNEITSFTTMTVFALEIHRQSWSNLWLFSCFFHLHLEHERNSNAIQYNTELMTG